MHRLALALLLLPGCDAAMSSDVGPSADVPAVDGGGVDAAASDVPGLDVPGLDAAAPDAGPSCEPTPGPANGGAYCDLVELALFTYDDASPRVELHGRVSPDGLAEGGCAVIDSVEVQVGGATVATLPGAGHWAVGSEQGLLAEGPAFDAITTRCMGDVNRFSGFGFLVHGRMDGGGFTARCADAEGGGRWPPAVRVLCQHNLDAVPFASYAMVSVSSFGAFSTLSTYVPHAPGEGLSTVHGAVRVIPGFGGGIFGPPPPMLDPWDDAGWGGSVSESSMAPWGDYSQLYLSAMHALPLEICPAPRTGPPDPMDPLPPVFITRLTGAGPRGAYRAEAYVDYCNTITSM
jgi:hypothetical protein